MSLFQVTSAVGGSVADTDKVAQIDDLSGSCEFASGWLGGVHGRRMAGWLELSFWGLREL